MQHSESDTCQTCKRSSPDHMPNIERSTTESHTVQFQVRSTQNWFRKRDAHMIRYMYKRSKPGSADIPTHSAASLHLAPHYPTGLTVETARHPSKSDLFRRRFISQLPESQTE